MLMAPILSVTNRFDKQYNIFFLYTKQNSHIVKTKMCKSFEVEFVAEI